MKETIIYQRVSTEEQNPENQLKDCISINSYGEYYLFEDRQSAWRDNSFREGFEEVRKLIKSNKIKHLIVWDFDRLYRNRKKFKEFLIFLKVYKTQLHSFRQVWMEELHKIPEPWNEIVYDLLINIWGHLAEDESNRKSDRVKIAVRRNEKGTFSYKGNKWGRKPISVKTRNKVKQLRKLNKSYNEICRLVTYSDKNNNPRNISKGMVFKILHPVHKISDEN